MLYLCCLCNKLAQDWFPPKTSAARCRFALPARRSYVRGILDDPGRTSQGFATSSSSDMLGLAVSSYAYSPSARPANAPTQQRAAVSTSVRMNAAGGACNHIGLST